ncbi:MULTISPECIES: hypothetical protein [unclassified Caballeronia]|uniref:hypothetical protein n=1 Tax=unclassified Caballeronia TaxID=2646786 RepID=UPI00286108EF|nr:MULTISPECIES: hypothetical protein [unclassified Caballeronia]MDR5773606.1 hypothetical protein [Caballeronia sp. LZ002]MDR5849040.1 hypothetical protein [Caballeronia sp. LZ003]
MVNAIVEDIGEDVEEEVTLRINDVRLVCFMGYSPYQVEKGKTYPVDINLEFFNEVELLESNDSRPSLSQIANSFAYTVTGLLHDDVLDAGVKFREQRFLSDYGYMTGKMVSVKVDRIDVEFL